MQVGVLGPLQVRRGDTEPLAVGGPRPRAVLVALALRPGRVVGVDQLVEDVWGHRLPAAPARTLVTVISRLRGALQAPDAIVGADGGYRLHIDPEAVDAHRFERLVIDGCRQLEQGESDTAARLLREALTLWRGEPLGDIGDAPLREWARPRLEELHLRALAGRMTADLAAGRAEELAGELVALRRRYPLHEGLAALQMRALAATGRRSEALTVYEQTRSALGEELGIGPGEELTALHLTVLRNEPVAPPPPRAEPIPSTGVTTPPADPVVTRCPPLPVLTPVGTQYVGREELLGRLLTSWTRVLAVGGARCVLLVGEPGVGKTRTAAQLAGAVHSDGGLVLAGRCDEELSAPYQPFIEALDWQTTHTPELTLGRLPGELARLLPDLPDRVRGLPSPVTSDPQVEQHRLFEAVTSWLAEISREQGLLLVIDDLHWATAPTLQLLRHVARGLATDQVGRTLVLTTHRDTDVDDGHPLVTMLGQLRRCAPVDEIVMDGLTREETRALLGQLAGRAIEDEQLLRLVHDPTRGNPFFAIELLAHLTDTGVLRYDAGGWRLLGDVGEQVPAGVRDVVTRRLTRLSPATTRLLQLAALAVGDAEVATLRELLGGDLESVLDAIDEALAARLIESSPPEAIRFTHGLVRDAITGTLSPTRRRRLHGRLADALENTAPERVDALAHHAAQAAFVDGRWFRAITHGLAAGEQALARHAADDAHHGFVRTLELIDACPRTEPRLELRARCGLGRAQRELGDPAARRTLLDAAQAALVHDQHDLAVRAMLATSRLMPSVVGGIDHERVRVLERLLAAPEGRIGEGDRVRLAASLAGELTFAVGEEDRRLVLADCAVTDAGAFDDPALEAWVRSVTNHTVMVPGRIDDLPAFHARAVSLADQAGDPTLQAMARFNEAMAHLGVGRFDRARRCAQDAAAVAAQECDPLVQWMTSVLTVQFSAYEGDLEVARDANAACLERGLELDEPDAAEWWGGIEALLANTDGTLPGLAEPLGEFADGHPDMPIWRAAHTLAVAEGGDHEQALGLLEAHDLRRADVMPEDWLRLAGLAQQARLADELGLVDLGAELLPVLEPHRHRWAHITLMCVLPVELAVGYAAAAAGRWDEAVTAARRGRELLHERNVQSHLPMASLQLARALLHRGEAGDAAEAHALATGGAAVARDMSMDALLPRFDEVLDCAG